MDRPLILLSGTPASGKDTITERLVEEYAGTYVHFKKHRAASPKQIKATYYNVSKSTFENMIRQGEFIQYHERYNRYYGISKRVLDDHLSRGLKPIIHTGKLANLMTIDKNVNHSTVKILLWTTKDIIKERLTLRHKNDPEEISRRLAAADEEMKELKMNGNLDKFNLIIENINMHYTVTLIHNYMNNKIHTRTIQNEKDKYKRYLANLNSI